MCPRARRRPNPSGRCSEAHVRRTSSSRGCCSWMAIMSGFWLMMYQLWDLQPNFIADWVDSRPMAAGAAVGCRRRSQARWSSKRPRGPDDPAAGPAQRQLVLHHPRGDRRGLADAPDAHARSDADRHGAWPPSACWWRAGPPARVLVFGILFFSLGEMMTGPKKSEYLALIAPPGKKGLYLGYVNIPVGVGVYLGSKIAGYVYGHLRREGRAGAASTSRRKRRFGQGKGWNGDVATLETVLGVKRTEAMAKLQEVTGLDPVAATRCSGTPIIPMPRSGFPSPPSASFRGHRALDLRPHGQTLERYECLRAKRGTAPKKSGGKTACLPPGPPLYCALFLKKADSLLCDVPKVLKRRSPWPSGLRSPPAAKCCARAPASAICCQTKSPKRRRNLRGTTRRASDRRVPDQAEPAVQPLTADSRSSHLT